MEVISIDGKEFYTEADLKKADPAFFFGCSRNRSMVLKKNIPKEEYIYAYQKKKTNQWIVCSEDYKPGKLLVSRTWVEENVPALSSNEYGNPTESKYQMAPPILELEVEEKFKDKDGNILEMEVRGDKHHKKCYFLVSDVSKAFNLPYLTKTITNKTEHHSYEQHIHYINFIRPGSINNGSQMNEKCLFLTYIGVLKVLFSSRSGNAETFQEWATEKLFTLQMGEQDQKDEMASDLIGVSPKTITDVFRKNTDKTPCVYLFKVKKESDDEFICKFGLTDNLPRRTKDHQKTYSKELKWGTIELIYFSIIDPKFLSDAETSVKRMLRPYSFSYENQTELVRLKKEDLKDIKTHYQMIQRSYLGCYHEMLEKIQKLETDLKIQELEFQQKVKDEKTAREKVEVELKHQHELYEQKIEVLEQKIEVLEQKNRVDLLVKELELERLRHN